MSNLLQVADLEMAKLHDTFHSEVITGKVGGLAGGADIDYATNAVTGQAQKTLPKILEDIDWSYVGLFAGGVTFTKRTDFALDSVGIQWVYVGNYPFTATSGTVPSEPIYQVVHVRDHNLLSNRNAAGAHLASAIDVSVPFDGQVKSPGYKSTSHYGGVIIGDNPVGVPGADWPSTTSLRDATTVSRKLVDEPTDCHAFADKTIIENASDYGGYGAVDVTTILRGNNVHNHVAAYQDRFSYEGSGTLENSWGMILWPAAPGTGTVKKRVGLQIRGISTTTAAIESNRGIDIDPKSSINENIGVIVRNGVCANSPSISYSSDQNSSGYTFYTSSFGKMWQQGKVGFGQATPTSTPFTFSIAELGSTVFGAFSADTANGAFVAASGDSKVSFISNLSLLGGWGNSTDAKCFYANTNTQNLGKDSKRWGTAYLVTAPNVSSDERLKDFENINNDEINCAYEVKKAIRKYRLKSDSKKIHFGVSAQEIVKIFEKNKLCATDYNIVNIDSEGFYSVCYDELLILIALTN